MNKDYLHLKPLDPPATLRQLAYQSLKDAILTGDMTPEEFYSEPLLAKMLNISRTPIREALQDLAGEGFVEAVPKRGYRITSLQSDEVEHLYDYRMAIELSIIEQVSGAIDEAGLEKIETILHLDHRASEDKSMKSFVKVNRDLHRYLASLTGNPYFIGSLDKILELTEWVALNVKRRELRPPHAVREHEKIYRALKEKDSKKAYGAMRRHLQTSKRLALQEIRVENEA